MKWDFNKLRSFMVVAEQRSVSRAAKALHITQQAVSHQIRCLEQDFGFALFRRAHRTIYLTKEGEQVLAEAKAYLLPLEASLERCHQGVAAVAGTLTIGAVAEVAAELLPAHLASFRQRYPAVQLRLTLGAEQQIEDRIIANEVDVGFLVFTKRVQLLELRPFQSARFLAVAAKSLIQQLGAPANFADLSRYPVVDYDPSCPSLMTWLNKNAVTVARKLQGKTAAISAADHACLRSFVLAGMGIGVLPHYLVEADIASGVLVEVLPGSDAIAAQIDCVTLKARATVPVIAAFVAQVFKAGPTQ